MKMEAAKAVLEELLAEEFRAADTRDSLLFIAWRTKALAVLTEHFGTDSVQVQEFKRVSQASRRNDGGPVFARLEAIQRGKAVLKVCLDTLSDRPDVSEPLDKTSIDPELWAYVEGLVAAEDWAKIPANVVIFLEHTVRTWAGNPKVGNAGNGVLVGKDLYGKVLSDDGPLVLGKTASEQQGWRGLGTGLAQAIGNVDRHHIQNRADLRRYAMGVLGLGSLLMTQLRYQYPTHTQQPNQPK